MHCNVLIYSCSSLYFHNTLIWKWYNCTAYTPTFNSFHFFSTFYFHTFHPQVAYLYIHHNGERIKESVWMTAVISDQGSRTLVCSTILSLPYCIFVILPYWYFEIFTSILHSALYRFSILKRAILLNLEVVLWPAMNRRTGFTISYFVCTWMYSETHCYHDLKCSLA